MTDYKFEMSPERRLGLDRDWGRARVTETVRRVLHER
jgi:hypothetical protein